VALPLCDNAGATLAVAHSICNTLNLQYCNDAVVVKLNQSLPWMVLLNSRIIASVIFTAAACHA